MLRITILATLLLWACTLNGRAGNAADLHDHQQLRIGVRMAFERSTPRARLPASAMHHVINGTRHERAPRKGSMMALLEVDRDKRAVALPVTDAMSLGVGYQYLRQEDLHLEVAETGGLSEGYSTHHVVLRARWQF